MIQIDGILSIIPVAIGTESGTLRVEENQPPIPAVVQILQTASGPVQVVIPTTALDNLIERLQAAKEVAEKETPKSDIYVPSSAQEVEHIAKASEAIEKGKT